MKQIKLLSMHIQNFKGCKDRTIEFGEKTRISGANATGKTTIFDAFTWLLFGKDSLGSSDFDIRPLDADGKMVDNIEISVAAKISVDGDEYDLEKVQKQKWVKKRGTNTREFQGKYLTDDEIEAECEKMINEFKDATGTDDDCVKLQENVQKIYELAGRTNLAKEKVLVAERQIEKNMMENKKNEEKI